MLRSGEGDVGSSDVAMATLLGLYPWVSARTSLSSESQAPTGLLPRKKRSAVALAAFEASGTELRRILKFNGIFLQVSSFSNV